MRCVVRHKNGNFGTAIPFFGGRHAFAAPVGAGNRSLNRRESMARTPSSMGTAIFGRREERPL